MLQVLNTTLQMEQRLNSTQKEISTYINHLFSFLLTNHLSKDFTFLLNFKNPRDNFSFLINQLLFVNTDESRTSLRKYLKGYNNFDPGENERRFYLRQLIKEIKEVLGKEEYGSFEEKKVAYDHDNHLLWIRWQPLKELYNKLNLEHKYRNQPVNVILPYYLYLTKMPPEYQNEFEKWCMTCGLWGFYPPKRVAKAFKLLTSVVKKLRNNGFGERWEWLCDLDTLWGYNARTKLSDMKGELEEWIAPKPTKRYTLENSKYKSKLVELFKKDQIRALQSVSGITEKSVDTFIKDPNGWVVNGSSNGIKTMLIDTKKVDEVKSSATKPAIFIEKSFDEIKHDFWCAKKQPAFEPSVKIELGWKDRLIIACGNTEYLRMAYISYNLERALPKDSFTTLFGGLRNKNRNYFKAMLQTGVGVNLPLDAKGFDQYIGSDEIEAFFDIIEWMIETLFLEKKELLQTMQLIRDSHKKYGWSLNILGEVKEWSTSGLPTGLRWTALIGSFVNYMRALYFKDILENIFKTDMLLRIKVQGDDDDFCLRSYFSAYLMLSLYDLYSIPVNKAKTFVSPTETEYLKKIVREDGVYGYPSRKLAPLIFVSPEKKIQDDQLFYLVDYSVLDGARRRGLNLFEYCDNIDLFRLMEVPKQIGGFGVWSNNIRDRKGMISVPHIVTGRFELSSLKKKALLRGYVNDNLEFVRGMNVDVRLDSFKKLIISRFVSGCIPRSANNILRIERQNKYIDTNFIDNQDEVALRFDRATSLRFTDYVVADEFVNFEWRSFISSVSNVNDKVDMIIKLASPKSAILINELRKRYSGLDFSHCVLSYYDSSFRLKLPFVSDWSDDFVSDIFKDLFCNISADLLLDFGCRLERTLPLRMSWEYACGQNIDKLSKPQSMARITVQPHFLLNSLLNKIDQPSLSGVFRLPKVWV